MGKYQVAASNPPNKALQPTAQPLRGFASAELGRYAQIANTFPFFPEP